MSLVFVDVEAWGSCPATGRLTEFGAVLYDQVQGEPHCTKCPTTAQHPWFHGIILSSTPSEKNPAVPAERAISDVPYHNLAATVFHEFESWLKVHSEGRPVAVSDNIAYDWQWLNEGFHRHLGHNPCGFSGRRISDFYAGLVGNFRETQQWKRYRITAHDHNPVHDCTGNLEAFQTIVQTLKKAKKADQFHPLSHNLFWQQSDIVKSFYLPKDTIVFSQE